ncbi:MAG: N-methyl-L-tryptophan oxidase, partial [Chloroflexota bacterium]
SANQGLPVSYDAIVVGLGAMGSAAAYQLASRGARVLGIEAFGRAHELGSSGGLTRIIRLAYFEHPDYVPMLRAAWELWPRIQADAGDEQLIQVTGGLYIGRRGSSVLDGSLKSAQTHGLAHEMLDAEETSRRFPAFRLDADMDALHEPLAGILFPDKCIGAHLSLAESSGAELHFQERVTGWSSDATGLTVTTDRGSYNAEKLIVAPGAWLPKLAPELNLPLRVERNALFWYEPLAHPQNFEADALPVWILELDDDYAFYGFPSLPGQGVKVSRHHGGRQVDPDEIDREATDEDEIAVRDFMARYMPAASGRRLDSRVCMYTNTPDFNFILDYHPEDKRVVIASPCSGHGFKFSNIIGSIAADLALEGRTTFEIGFLSIDRFATG